MLVTMLHKNNTLFTADGKENCEQYGCLFFSPAADIFCPKV